MWTMSEHAAFPWYFPSVWRGLRLKKHAPLSCAMTCTSMVLPVPVAPYSSSDRTAATLTHKTPKQPCLSPHWQRISDSQMYCEADAACIYEGIDAGRTLEIMLFPHMARTKCNTMVLVG